MKITFKSFKLHFELNKKLLTTFSSIFSNKITTRFRSTMTEIIPPECVRGMKTLDRNKFQIDFSIPIIKFKSEILTKKDVTFINVLKPYLLKLQNFKAIQPTKECNEKSDDYKLVFLNPERINSWSDFNADDISNLTSVGIVEDNFQRQTITIKYDNWKFEDIIKAILPKDQENVSGFSIVGHIIHLNLREHVDDYKTIIGEVLLDKIKNCKTVVNKTNQIDNAYRNFSMELLCGENNFITKVKENNCQFEFDFSKVYWNPRLGTEHERILNKLKQNDVLFDVFAGVGPFSIPASRKRCIVFANDLNPESFKWLNHNAELNRIKKDFKTFNMDGREFIQTIFSKFLISGYKDFDKTITGGSVIHITMNLPAMAVTFLDAFVSICENCSTNWICELPIIVHVYCFVCSGNPQEFANDLVKENIGIITEDIIETTYIRNVAPNKEMMRVSFKLPNKILFLRKQHEKRKNIAHNENEPNHKSVKL